MDDTLLARLDTASLAVPGRPTRALIVANERDTPFDGIAFLRADFRTTVTAPVTVLAADGGLVAARVIEETLGPIEDDGRRRWRFVLEFRVTLPPHTIVGYSAFWGEPPETVPDTHWVGPRLEATERPCVPGEITLPARW